MTTPIEFSPVRLTPPHVNLASSRTARETTISVQKKKEVYHYRDETNLMTGPFDLATLQLWYQNGLIPSDLPIYDGASPHAIPLSELLSSKGITSIIESNNWFLWTDSKTPFHSLNTRLNKCFLSKHQINDFKLLSIVSQTHQITLNNFQEFEDFLDQVKEISEDIKSLHFNEFAEPFAMWTYKTLNELNCNISLEELKALLLDTNPDSLKSFFLKNIQPEKHALKVFNSYNQWRLFIPIYVCSD